ncbi:MAG: VOC family protein [Candidatus Micrarchaeaceae archaeon]
MKDEISEVVHFEIPARDPEKLRKFYTGVFGWKFKNSAAQNMQYWNIDTGTRHSPGVEGGLYKKGSLKQTPVNYIATTDLAETMAEVERAGGRVVVGDRNTPGHGRTALCEDPEGNSIGLFESQSRGMFRERGRQSQSGANRIKSSRRNDRTKDSK